ncbi:alpha/beta hydrolase [Rathayibacter sp. VKM Ac-2760]|uniref:alpha/beta hydrolase family protein n=1 Tax=Rathayibacter sp. VKM Ac-2760 TaxID=2609253 RepID=UPI001315E1F1|nr:alpha/beta hydrolase [Rathayibacter sp. VKM Ac-2760]QHC58683.1 alpha/beta fold hydrolase [Rathayibacter sp. VKM Ac-2760]
MIAPDIAATLVTLTTEDGWTIDALQYVAPELETVAPADRVGIVHIHGKGANMTTGSPRYLPALLPGAVHLSINMRCHDLATDTRRDDVPAGGGMYESLRDGHYDLAAAVRHLRAAGIGTVILAGHSSGGWYVGDYAARYHDVEGRFLLSPLTDNKTRVAWWYPGGVGFAEKDAEAKALMAAGRPHDLMLVPSNYWAISADAWTQRVGEVDGTWLAAVQADDSPVLMVWGTAEDRDALWRELYPSFPEARAWAAVENADHDFSGGDEYEVAGLLREWLLDLTGVDVVGTAALPTPVTPLHRG